MKKLYCKNYCSDGYPKNSIFNLSNEHSKWLERLANWRDRSSTVSHVVYEVDNFQFAGEWGFTNSLSHDDLLKIGWNKDAIRFQELKYKALFDDEEVEIVNVEGGVVYLGWPGIFTYGHWIHDALPRIYMLKNYLRISHITVLVPQHLNNNIYELLDILNINYLIYKIDKKYHVNKVLIPSFTSHGINYPVDFHRECYDYYFDKLCKCNTLDSKKIYLKHTTLTSVNHPRSISNELSLISALEDIGCIIKEPSCMSMSEQIKLFGGLNDLVGIDCSAMHNLVFSELNSRQLVICSSERINLVHLCISSLKDSDLYIYETNSNSANILFDTIPIKNWLFN